MKRRPLLWLNALCLDAPLVALAWQMLFASTFHMALTKGECVALFLTAWLIYLADRWADSLSLAPGSPRSTRADFCLRHKKLWVVILLVVGLCDGVTILRDLTPATILAGSCLGTLALVYLVANYAFSKVWKTIPLKEVTIGFLFATGTVLVLLPKAGSGLLFAALLFGCLCSANCMSIAVWERELDEKQGKHSFATRSSGADLWVRIWCVWVLLASSSLLAVRRFEPLSACLALSSALLFGLHFVSIPRNERTALADLVLLTPLLFLAGERLL